MDTTRQTPPPTPALGAGGGAPRCGSIRGRKACWAAGCVRSHHRCVPPRFAKGQVVKVRGEYGKVVRPLPNKRYQLQSLEDMHRRFVAREAQMAPGTVAHGRSVAILPSGRVVPRSMLKPLFRLSASESVYTYQGEPVLLRHGRVDARASRTSILGLLERLAWGIGGVRAAPDGRPRCDPFQWNSDQVCRDQGYAGGCGSNKHPTHCNPGNERSGSAAQRAVRRYRQQVPTRTACKARCRAWPESTRQQRREKNACYASCKTAAAAPAAAACKARCHAKPGLTRQQRRNKDACFARCKPGAT